MEEFGGGGEGGGGVMIRLGEYLKNMPNSFNVSNINCTSFTSQLLHKVRFRSWFEQ